MVLPPAYTTAVRTVFREEGFVFVTFLTAYERHIARTGRTGGECPASPLTMSTVRGLICFSLALFETRLQRASAVYSPDASRTYDPP